MILPALLELIQDDEIVNHPTAIRVYCRLLREPTILYEPAEVITWKMGHRLKVSRERVGMALDLLVRRGYVVEHGRASRRVRRVTIPLMRQCGDGDAPPQRLRP